MTWTMVDGVGMPSVEARVPADDPAVTLGWSVFETLGYPGADLDLHLARLTHSCLRTHIDPPPAALLRREIEAVGQRFPQGARIRITLTGGGHRLVRGEPVDPSRRHRPVRAVRGPYCHEPFLGGGVKHGSRLPWVIALRESGVDEVLLVDDDGMFREGTTSGILAVIDGALHTAPDDGTILASTAVTGLVMRAVELGLPVVRSRIPADGPWDALYIASATRNLAPVVELDGQPMVGFDAVGQKLIS
jgi:branched-subunit amino acid aminotransferase/4-amino-4-deoxychorismate lyase